MTAPQTADGADDTDRDQVEAELAAAIAALLVANGPSAAWPTLVTANLAGLLQQFLTRSGLDLADSMGVSSTDASTAVDKAVADLLPQVESDAADMLAQSAKDITAKDPGDDETTAEALEHDSDVSSNLTATSLLTDAREKLRTAIAKTFGAVKKVWTARDDSRTRPAHVEMNGQTVLIDKPFKAPGDIPMSGPGDQSAPIDLWANCRCRTRFIAGPDGFGVKAGKADG